MSVLTTIRQGEGLFWGAVKRLAKTLLCFHLPTGGLLRPTWRALYGLHVLIRESFIWAGRFFWSEPLFRSQCETVGRGLRMEKLPYMNGTGRIILGDNVELSGKPSFRFGNSVHGNPQLRIGHGTFIGHNSSITVGESVDIGEHCLFAGSVMIRDYDGHPLDAAERRSGRRVRANEIRPVRIGNDVWLGNGASILKGVTIGDRSVVAAGAIVSRDVPPDSVVAGNPARVVKSINKTTRPNFA